MKQEKKPQNTEDKTSSPLAEQLRILRQQLQDGTLAWPDTAVSHLAQDLSHPDDASTAKDMEMLSLVVDAALRGEDISQTYPKFYERMQASSELKQAFADVLSVLQEDAIPLPDFPPADLSFLQRAVSPPPAIKQPAPNLWEAVWRLLPSLLNQRFTPVLAGYRSGQAWLDEESTLLIHNAFDAGSLTWEATLEALARPDAPGQMGLFLSANVTSEQEPFPPLQATVQWSDYVETAVLDRYGRAHFPPFPVTLILDDTGTAVAHDLRLKIEPVAS